MGSHRAPGLRSSGCARHCTIANQSRVRALRNGRARIVNTRYAASAALQHHTLSACPLAFRKQPSGQSSSRTLRTEIRTTLTA